METLTALPDEQAQDALACIRAMPIFKSSKKTDWQSLLYGLRGVNDLDPSYNPKIITSIGGTDREPPIAAPFNAVPAMELASTLVESGLKPTVTLTSAYKYAVECNGVDEVGASANWDTTRAAYQKVIEEFYPGLSGVVSFDVLDPRGVDQYPGFLRDSATKISASSDSLQATAQKYGSSGETYLTYMLSHTQAFRDFQRRPVDRFVIKVGAQSEQRFSTWQKAVIEDCLDDAVIDGFVPNRINQDEGSYGQISLFYPRIGARPPYFAEAPDEPMLGEIAEIETYEGMLDRLDYSVLTRYQGLAKALGCTAITPQEYLEVLQ